LNSKKPGSGNVIRYWTIWIITISLLSVLFIKGVFSLMDKFNAWTGLGMGLLLYVLMALMQAKRSITPLRYPLFQAMDLGFMHKDVTFSSRDGLALSGWFVPGRNGATVVITHGLSGNRLSGTHAARLLSKQGFAVLLYELRGHGRSQADINTWGWVEINDLLGAIDYLRSRPDVDPERIGALGYSLGGQISLRAAAQERWIKAVAAEGPTFAALSDHILSSAFSLRKLVLYPWLWIMYNFQVLLTGVAQPLGVVKETPKIAPRPILLIAAGRGEEYLMARRLFEVAGEPKQLYHVPEASHLECSRARPEEYAQKLVDFFKAALL
jgi:alpha-beta hydrolase superfamily lysophospholipase